MELGPRPLVSVESAELPRLVPQGTTTVARRDHCRSTSSRSQPLPVLVASVASKTSSPVTHAAGIDVRESKIRSVRSALVIVASGASYASSTTSPTRAALTTSGASVNENAPRSSPGCARTTTREVTSPARVLSTAQRVAPSNAPSSAGTTKRVRPAPGAE